MLSLRTSTQPIIRSMSMSRSNQTNRPIQREVTRRGLSTPTMASPLTIQTARRIQQQCRWIQGAPVWKLQYHHHTNTTRRGLATHSTSSTTAPTHELDGVSIGDVHVPHLLPTAFTRPDLIPAGYLAPQLQTDSQETLQTIKWMMQKYLLHQDIYLIGPPGYHRRQLAFRFGEIIQREMEYLAISRDTTESDLKQRTEVVKGTLHHIDQSPVRCALFGRILVLDGIEKAERNVLPTLNNLLENREMQLDDGRFLLHHSAYDALLKKGLTQADLTQRKLLRCHENFRVIALGLPVPRYQGYSLDPPLRSRFQARAVVNLPLLSQLEIFTIKYPNIERELLTQLLQFRETLRIFESENAATHLSTSGPSKMPHFPSVQMEVLLKVLNQLPVELQRLSITPQSINQIWPFNLLCDSIQLQTIYEAMDRFHLHPAKRIADQTGKTTIQIVDITTMYPKLWIQGQPTVLQTAQPEGILLQTPTSLISTPEQTLDLVATQSKIPTSNHLTASTSSTSQSPQRSSVQYRLPLGQTIEVTLTTASPIQGQSESTAPITHKFQLQGSIPEGSTSSNSVSNNESFIPTLYHHRFLAPLLLDLSVGKDICLIGGKGAGKSSFVRWLASHFLHFAPHQIHTVHLFKDMSSRDLLQRRSTDSDGNTVWHTNSMINAALTGGLAILDGLERIPPATLQVIRRLIEDREISLFDGTRLMRHDRYLKLLETHSPEQLQSLKIFPILPSFRIIALANPPNISGSIGSSSSSAAATGQTTQSPWLIEESIPLYAFHQMGVLDDEAKKDILIQLFPKVKTQEIEKVLRFVDLLSTPRATNEKKGNAHTPAVSVHSGSTFSFSLRQLIQLLTHHAAYPNDFLAHIKRMVLYEFLPIPQKQLLDSLIETSEFAHEPIQPVPNLNQLLPRVDQGRLHIGDVSYPLSTRQSNPELIPRILFYNIHNHLLILQGLLRDWIVDELDGQTKPFSHRRHLLLIGNQGVGKNKLIDRLLELLHLEREYMQLHRDTTVQALTLSPSLVDGKIFYDDSALVRAVKYGRVLVIDEADKAPLEVVAILKGLVQDGQMTLSDGRKIVAQVPKGFNDKTMREQFIQIHPDFKLIVLANRPGFPFLGNDFFRENGDVFSVHSIPNPEPNSEIDLLRSYGPHVPLELIQQLVNVFGELRQLVLDGTFTYPYSTRELVAIVKHLEQFPGDGLLVALENVLDFDRFDPTASRNLKEVFGRHGIPLISRTLQLGVEINLTEAKPLPQPKLVQTWTSKVGAATIKRNGLSANPTSATASGTPGLGQRLFSTAAAAFSAVTGTTTPPTPIASSSISSLLSSTPLTGRSWTLHLDGQLKTNDNYENRRLNVFTEEKATFKVPFPSNASRSLAISTLADDSIHVLVSNSLCLHSYFPHSTGGYHKYVTIELEDWLPMYEIPDESIQMIAIPNSQQLVIFAPTHNMLLMIQFKKDESATSEANKSGHQPLPQCVTSVVALQPPNGNQQVSSTFLEYLTPGFKMPRWHSRAPNQNQPDPPKPFQLLDSLTSSGLLLFLQPQGRFFMVLDLTPETLSKQAGNETMIKGKQIASNPTVAVTKLGHVPIGVLFIVDLNGLPTGTYIEKLVALSPNLFILETNKQRFVSHGPSSNWTWSPITTDDGHFIAHEHGWFYSPLDNVGVDQERNNSSGENITVDGKLRKNAQKRFKPLQGVPMDYLDQTTTESSASPSSSSNIPSAQAIFIPRSLVSPAASPTSPSSSATTTAILNAFQRNSALLTPPSPSSLYRFGSGSLFDAGTNPNSSESSLYEVPFPAPMASDPRTTAEATYHSWLSTLLPNSSQLAMPSYFTYHLPPPTPDSTLTGPYISKVEQPVLSLIDLYGRRIAHIPIRPHPSDTVSASRAQAKIGIEKFMSIGGSTSSSKSSFRSRREAEEQQLKVELDEQALEESLGTSGAAASDDHHPNDSGTFSWSRDRIISLRVLPQSGDLVTLAAGGRVRIWEVDPQRLMGASTNWKRLFGITGQLDKPLRLELDSDKKREASAPKVGKVDKENKPHVGGNQWKGGTGGSDTAGLGGKAGPYRFDAGHDVHQMAPEEKAKVSAEVAAAAKALGQQELAKRLNAIDLPPDDHALYSQYQAKVLKQIHQLRLILEQAEARHIEREWLRNQKDGDLDDNKIVDAMTGERMVYRRRGVPIAQAGVIQRLPKRLHFVMDCSGSMYRFNGSDQRLERLLEATLLIMESLDGFETKYSYSIVGHSGDSASVPFVPYGSAPKSRKDRLKVLQRMYAHSQYCSSGDHTLEAVRAGIQDVVANEADDYLTIIVSDANLRRYGIAPQQLGAALISDPRVNAFVIFIASLQDEVHRIMPLMPPGKAFFCGETSQLPNMFRTILTASEIIAS